MYSKNLVISSPGSARHASSRALRPTRSPLLVKAVSVLPPSTGSSPKSIKLEKFFIDKAGVQYPALPWDFGFRSGAGRLYEDRYGETPDSLFSVATENFKQEFIALRCSTRFRSSDDDTPPKNFMSKAFFDLSNNLGSRLGKADQFLEDKGLLSKLTKPEQMLLMEDLEKTPECSEVKQRIRSLTISNPGVARREQEREVVQGKLQSPFWVKAPFYSLCWLLDVLYEGKPIQKFWVLEVVARIPYFASISILHLYESLGFWRAGAELRKIHFAEEWNEMHHLQIMESLGGDVAWFDRFVADHSAVFYYWLLIVFYLISPKLAYNFMQRVELHAMDTYAEFVVENKELLKTIPPPMVALEYYKNEDLYLFDEFQKSNKSTVEPRRPECENLYDVFCNIRDDEGEHVKTMIACQTTSIADDLAESRKATRSTSSVDIE
jgi:ubiquinol oxidase